MPNLLIFTVRIPIKLLQNQRLNFTKQHLEQKSDFKNVVFTDESWFVLGKNSKWVWVDKHNITDNVLQHKVAHPPKVMIWGCRL